jgi:pyruvate formate-lyase/glycerol dehydratase family glycyl radical enzyme
MLPSYRQAGVVCERVLAMQTDCGYHIAAVWRAESFALTVGQPMTIRRALALNAVLERSALPLIPGELLVGSGLGRFAAAGDPAALEAAQACLREIGSRGFATTSDHAAPDYPTALRIGLRGLMARVEEALAQPHTRMQEAFLHSVAIALDGASRHIRRWAQAAAAAAEASVEWAPLLTAQAAQLTRLAEEPAASFWDAVQLTYLHHAIFQMDERYAMALGRLDQFLFPYYQADLAAGHITAHEAQAILDHLFAKLAHGWDIQNIALGGVDADGHDAVNDLTYMCLEACKRIGQPGGNVTARVSGQAPPAYLEKCVDVIRTGIGFPALFNDEVEIPALLACGYPLEDARNYCFVGCIEVYVPGRHAPWSDSRFNLLRCVNLALWDGFDPVTEQHCGPHTGEADTWERFYQAFLAQVRAGLSAHVTEFNAIKQAAEDRADDLTSPLLSAFFDDCIARGLDVAAGGARYPANHGVACMGIGSTADALMALKRFVFEERRFTLEEMRQMLAANFAGYEAERRLLMTGAPKFGNDEPEVDAIAAEVAEVFGKECLTYQTPRGGQYWSLMAANVSNIYAGKEVGATPDGRLAFEPLSDAASPSFGRDRQGPTAVARSVAKLDYSWHPGGNVINMKLHPTALAGEAGVVALAALIRTCFDLGGVQLQFNTTDREALIDAMAHPETHAHLVVRVSGFSAYFTQLEREVQEDILARTEHLLAQGA